MTTLTVSLGTKAGPAVAGLESAALAETMRGGLSDMMEAMRETTINRGGGCYFLYEPFVFFPEER
jgi:hypothetical protein